MGVQLQMGALASQINLRPILSLDHRFVLDYQFVLDDQFVLDYPKVELR